MLKVHSTIQQIRFSLHHELRKLYPEEESGSLAKLILEHSGFPPDRLLSDPQLVPDSSTVLQINEIVHEIHTGKPLQYILGYAHFYDMVIKVNKNVLIPRPETEEMVYRIIERVNEQPRRILDLGTGSGCIALALKKQFPEAEIYGVDVSRSALDIAEVNGNSLGLDVVWKEDDILKGLTPGIEGRFDLIISNPPYVLDSERSEMARNVLDFEPDIALFVKDEDPLVYYSAIAETCRKFLDEDGTLWLEINERYGTETIRLLEDAGFQEITILSDIHNKERFIEATW